MLDERQVLVVAYRLDSRHCLTARPERSGRGLLGPAVVNDFALERGLVLLAHGAFAPGLPELANFFVVVVLVVAGEGALELPDPLAHRPAELGQPLRPEHDQRDDQDDDDFKRSDVGHQLTLLEERVNGSAASTLNLHPTRRYCSQIAG